MVVYLVECSIDKGNTYSFVGERFYLNTPIFKTKQEASSFLRRRYIEIRTDGYNMGVKWLGRKWYRVSKYNLEEIK